MQDELAHFQFLCMSIHRSVQQTFQRPTQADDIDSSWLDLLLGNYCIVISAIPLFSTIIRQMACWVRWIFNYCCAFTLGCDWHFGSTAYNVNDWHFDSIRFVFITYRKSSLQGNMHCICGVEESAITKICVLIICPIYFGVRRQGCKLIRWYLYMGGLKGHVKYERIVWLYDSFVLNFSNEKKLKEIWKKLWKQL